MARSRKRTPWNVFSKAVAHHGEGHVDYGAKKLNMCVVEIDDNNECLVRTIGGDSSNNKNDVLVFEED